MFTSSQLEKGISGVGINRGWIDKCGRGSVAALGPELTPPLTDAVQPTMLYPNPKIHC